SSFQYGYNVSVINSPAPYMQDFYNQTYIDRHGVPMDASFQTLLWSLTVSMYPLGGFFGSLMVGPLVNNCGRKGTLLINNLFSIVAAVLMGTSEIAKTYEVIIISRVIMGIYCIALITALGSLAMAELFVHRFVCFTRTKAGTINIMLVWSHRATRSWAVTLQCTKTERCHPTCSCCRTIRSKMHGRDTAVLRDCNQFYLIEMVCSPAPSCPVPCLGLAWKEASTTRPCRGCACR
uniref:Major facilitator superfamily (MFS) profile domain-containing protein n=1 Tax=Pavo cristatus TaxID=9049 RepID=A0A8C9L6Z7_PAVCR